MSYRDRSKDRRDDMKDGDDSRAYSLTNSSDPKLLNSRVFIGNAPTDKVTRAEIEDKFAKYGKVSAVSVHRGFAFVQYERDEDAQEAAKQEDGGLFKGFKIDVCVASARRRERDSRPPDRRRSPPYGDRGSRDYRDKSPHRDRGFGNDRGRPERFPREDRFRDERPREPFYDGPRRRYDDPLDRRFDIRDDPFKIRRDPFVDPYRDLAYTREPIVPDPLDNRYPHDCEIIVPNKMQRTYAEHVENRLKNLGLRVDLLFPHDETPVPQVLDDITRRGCRYAIVVMPQNEQHKSATVNILWGTPQEHRNMPLDDAMSLIARSFDSYLQSVRDNKVPVAVTPVVPVRGTDATLAVKNPPAAEGTVQVLLTLLADGRPLSVPELDKVIRNLQERKQRLLEEVEAPTPTPAAVVAPVSAPVSAPHKTEPLPITAPSTEKEIADQQAELQKRILSILNNSPATPPVVNSAPTVSTPQPPPHINSNNNWSNPNPSPAQPSSASTVINFDNPSVQKALDNLIQSGPSLLRSLQGGAPNLMGMQPPGSSQQQAAGTSQQFPIPTLTHQQQQPHSQPQHLPGLGGMGMRNPHPMNQQRHPLTGNTMNFMGPRSMLGRY